MKRNSLTSIIRVLEIFQIIFPTSGYLNISEVVRHINRERKTEINVFINLNRDTTDTGISLQYAETTRELNHLPSLIKTDRSFVTPLQKSFSEQSLTLAWLTGDTVNNTFAAIDGLLWQLHFKDILLLYHHPKQLRQELLFIFKLCWEYGFTSILIWVDHQLYTYHPYPALTIKRLEDVSEFGNKWHLYNFQGYQWAQATVELAPRFFSYTNRHGQLRRAGYLYKMISLFLTHHNGTIKYYFIDLLKDNSVAAMLKVFEANGFTFAPFLTSYTDYLLASNALYLGKSVLMVPTAKEIPESLYLLVPFDSMVWSVILFSGFLFFLLINMINFQQRRAIDLGDAFLQAFNVIIFLSVSTINGKSVLNLTLTLLFLFTGIFLTNYYSSSLSSLYTSKVYEPALEYIADIEHTDLHIYEYSLDVRIYEQIKGLPPIIYQRVYTDNDTAMFINRKNLNMNYMYEGLEDIISYVMSQQMYLKISVAKKLQEPLWYRPLIVHMQHRSPIFEQFNQFLSQIRDSGLLIKFQQDAYWEGILSGDLHLMKDPEISEALKLEYFKYAFLILALGMIGGFFTCLIELMYSHFRKNASNAVISLNDLSGN